MASYGYETGNPDTFAVKEAYRTIRTNIMFSVPKEGCRVICFTSSVQGEGKTTTSANVALTFAQNEKKVLLMDLDLRRPKIHRFLKLKSVPGITNYLGGFNAEEEIIRKDVYRNLDVICCGTLSPNPSEMLSSELLLALITKLKNRYDYIILDTPPVNVVSDALGAVKFSDVTVLVARYKYSTHPEIKKAIRQIHFVGGKIAGVVVNGAEDIKKRKYEKYQNSYYEDAGQGSPERSDD